MRAYLILAIVTLFSFQSLKAQTLEEQFNSMMEKSSNYQDYKVIKMDEIKEYWVQISDTLRLAKSQKSRLKAEIEELTSRIDSLNNSLEKVKTDLASSKQANDSISFLGAQLSKAVYHIVVWVLILVFAVLAVIAYMMYHSSNRVTNRMKQEYAQLNRDYEEHRDKSREMQVKLKRELQTAVNTIEDMKRGGSSRR